MVQKCLLCDQGTVQPYNNTSRKCQPHHQVICPNKFLIPGNRTHDPLCSADFDLVKFMEDVIIKDTSKQISGTKSGKFVWGYRCSVTVYIYDYGNKV